MYIGYDGLSYPLYARTQVRLYKHTPPGYDTQPPHGAVISESYMLVRPNPGSAVQGI